MNGDHVIIIVGVAFALLIARSVWMYAQAKAKLGRAMAARKFTVVSARSAGVFRDRGSIAAAVRTKFMDFDVLARGTDGIEQRLIFSAEFDRLSGRLRDAGFLDSEDSASTTQSLPTAP